MLRDRLKERRQSMFQHTVTVYNILAAPGGGIESHITVLRGVLLSESKARNVNASGLAGADAATLYIPFGVEAVDGITGEPKVYVEPIEWAYFVNNGFPDRLASTWTLGLDGEGEGDSFFVRGEVVEPGLDMGEMHLEHDGVYNITKVDRKDYGRLQHFEVGGN